MARVRSSLYYGLLVSAIVLIVCVWCGALLWLVVAFGVGVDRLGGGCYVIVAGSCSSVFLFVCFCFLMFTY
jgi:hypothetical protein